MLRKLFLTVTLAYIASTITFFGGISLLIKINDYLVNELNVYYSIEGFEPLIALTFFGGMTFLWPALQWFYFKRIAKKLEYKPKISLILYISIVGWLVIAFWISIIPALFLLHTTSVKFGFNVQTLVSFGVTYLFYFPIACLGSGELNKK